ncbi:hypothetical protein ACO0RG_001623 [Hanseniaspora osmophila]
MSSLLLSAPVLLSLLSAAFAAHSTESTSSTSTILTSTSVTATKTSIPDGQVLSTLWTEGLIMCLLVTFLLISILVMAIKWTSSITISYGALEKSNNPIKKTQ